MSASQPDENNNNTNQPKDESDQQERSGALEKIFTALSIVLLLSLTGYLGWQATEDPTPPEFKIEAQPAESRGKFNAVKIAVSNSGTMAAQAVNVTGEAMAPDGAPVTAEATIDWLPGRSKRQVTLIFPSDTSSTHTQYNVTGYQNP